MNHGHGHTHGHGREEMTPRAMLAYLPVHASGSVPVSVPVIVNISGVANAARAKVKGSRTKKRVGTYGEEITDNDGNYDDTGDFDNEMHTEWNLRRCAVDALAVLAVCLTPLKDKLWSQETLQRESGIFAPGGMTEGKIDEAYDGSCS